MAQKKTLEMVRSGEFDIHTYGVSHCGVSDEFKIRYHLKCTCSPKLDNRGFLFDQLNIQAYFESIKRTQLSCERLTVVCLDQLLEHILTENPSCQIYKMELTLSPEPFLASMTHAVENDDNPLTKPAKVAKAAGKVVLAKRKSGKVPTGHRLIHLPTMVNGSEAVDERVHDPNHQHKPSHDHYLFDETRGGSDDV